MSVLRWDSGGWIQDNDRWRKNKLLSYPLDSIVAKGDDIAEMSTRTFWVDPEKTRDDASQVESPIPALSLAESPSPMTVSSSANLLPLIRWFPFARSPYRLTPRCSCLRARFRMSNAISSAIRTTLLSVGWLLTSLSLCLGSLRSFRQITQNDLKTDGSAGLRKATITIGRHWQKLTFSNTGLSEKSDAVKMFARRAHRYKVQKKVPSVVLLVTHEIEGEVESPLGSLWPGLPLIATLSREMASLNDMTADGHSGSHSAGHGRFWQNLKRRSSEARLPLFWSIVMWWIRHSIANVFDCRIILIDRDRGMEAGDLTWHRWAGVLGIFDTSVPCTFMRTLWFSSFLCDGNEHMLDFLRSSSSIELRMTRL
jgi:hypothetical protein